MSRAAAGLLRRLALGLGLALLLLVGGCAGLKPALQALPGVGADKPPAPEPVLRLEVLAPEPVRKLLEQHLDLARLARLGVDEALDETEWQRLLGAAPGQVRELMQTEGYFDPQVLVRRTPGAEGKAARVTVEVSAGPQVQVVALQLVIEGPLTEAATAGDAEAVAAQDQVRQNLPLQAGRPFRNAEWSETKQVLLARLRAAGYASARVTESQADVDPQQGQALLSVVASSGPLYRAGPVQVEGLKVHDAETVRHLAGFGEGAALTETRLLDYQDRLQKAGLFERASVSYEPDERRAAATPVRVVVGESPLRQATVGLGISANTGPRASLEHTHRRPFGWAATAYNKLEWARASQTWTGDLYSHPGEGFYRNLVGVQLSRVKGDSDVVLSQRLRLGRTQDRQRVERLYFVEWLRSQVNNSSGDNAATAVSLNYHLVWRELDSIVLPTRGYSASLQGGAGEALFNDSASGPFARAYARLTGYLPLPSQWHLQARLEAGQVFKRSDVQVPDALGFRAGGDDSVRGYGYRDLAPVDSNGNLYSGMVLLTGSLELAHPVSANLPSVWGAFFIDAGNAADTWSSYRAVRGYGVGVRWRSPIGPLRADLAWADELRRMRLHLSVGIAF